MDVVLLQVRTLFVSGLPMDAKPRELYLLFRAYEVCTQLITLFATATCRYSYWEINWEKSSILGCRLSVLFV